MKTATLNEKIASLLAGQIIILNRTSTGYCTVERSSDGKTLRFVRTIGHRVSVFRTCTIQ